MHFRVNQDHMISEWLRWNKQNPLISRSVLHYRDFQMLCHMILIYIFAHIRKNILLLKIGNT